MSISSGRFPDVFKIGKLKPLFKNGSKTDPRNYWPISLLPLISKVLERIVQTIHGVSWQIQHFIQISIRISKNYSNNFCLSYLTEKISQGFDSGLLTGMILIDLQKAFDTIDWYDMIWQLYFLSVKTIAIWVFIISSCYSICNR